MQCSCAVLLDVSYDPLSDKDGAYGAKTFKAADGYSIEYDGNLLKVSHSGRTAVWGAARVDYAKPLETAVAAPVVVPEPVKEVAKPVEPPKPVAQPVQQQRPQQFQGKRR